MPCAHFEREIAHIGNCLCLEGQTHTRFTMNLETKPLAAYYPDDSQLSEYEKDYLFDLLGFRIIRAALSPSQVERINQWVDSQPARKPGEWFDNVEVHSYQGHDGTNYQNVIEGGEIFEELIDSPTWIGDVRRYIMNGFNALSINECFLNVRQQSGFIGIHSGGHVAAYPAMFRHHTGAWNVGQVNILMALSDIGPGDGATVVVPSSHKSHMVHPVLMDSKHRAYRDDFVAGKALMAQEVYLNKGDAIMFTDAICHGSAERVNSGERRTMVYRYSPHGVMPRYHYIPSVELLARLTLERRQIVQPVPPRLAPGRALMAR